MQYTGTVSLIAFAWEMFRGVVVSLVLLLMDSIPRIIDAGIETFHGWLNPPSESYEETDPEESRLSEGTTLPDEVVLLPVNEVL
jgi:hypothetical protein